VNFDKIIVDADVCIKLGKISSRNYIELVLPLLSDNLYIHQHVYNEIHWPQHATTQVNTLLKDGRILVVNDRLWDPLERALYTETVKRLSRIMVHPKRPTHHQGEIHSLAAAKTMGITIFFSDEKSLQVKVDRLLNTGIEENGIRCLSLRESICLFAKDELCGLTRSEAREIWAGCQLDIVEFDQGIWPPNDPL
jgi:hypothetical protein